MRTARLHRAAHRLTRLASGTDVPGTLDQVLERAQLPDPDRSAGVKLLSRVADLGSHPELPPIGEPGRRVDVDASGIDAELEGSGGSGAAGDDRLRVAAAVRVDVLDRLRHRVDHADRQLEGKILGVP